MARVRRRKDTPERIAESPYILTQDTLLASPWQDSFPQKDLPLVLEIGSGRGRFITLHGRFHPEFNHFGIDIVPEILVDAVKKHTKGEGISDNVRFLLADAKTLVDIFGEASIAKIYLNFSDPWPKKRHAKRRLTHHHFLEVYQQLLKEDGELVFKTDGLPLFDFSLEELKAANWQIIEEIRDLYAYLPEDNIATEYERRFVREGLPIYKLVAKKPKSD